MSQSWRSQLEAGLENVPGTAELTDTRMPWDMFAELAPKHVSGTHTLPTECLAARFAMAGLVTKLPPRELDVPDCHQPCWGTNCSITLQPRQVSQISNWAPLSPAGLKLAAAMQRHPQYLQYLQKELAAGQVKAIQSTSRIEPHQR